MRWAVAICLGGALALASCGPRPAEEAGDHGGPGGEPAYEQHVETEEELEPLEPVSAALVGAPNSAFAVIEPSEVGVFAAPSIRTALDGLISPEAFEDEAAVSVTIREIGDEAIADVVRENIPDDSVAAGHVRVEFRREAEGWFPTTAYRRWMCRRGVNANRWTAELCP